MNVFSTTTASSSTNTTSTNTTAISPSAFSPSFVYPIFGEEERIYGYRDLIIKLWFTSGSLRNYLSIEYEGKPLDKSRALDVEGTLAEFIPEGE